MRKTTAFIILATIIAATLFWLFVSTFYTIMALVVGIIAILGLAFIRWGFDYLAKKQLKYRERLRLAFIAGF